MKYPKIRLPMERHGLAQDFSAGGRTQQEFARECDINTIMRKYERDGLLDHVMREGGVYTDYTEIADFHTAMNVVREAQEMFDTLPAALREEFGNDPGEFLEWTDTATEEQLREKGLVPPLPVPEEPAIAPGGEPAPVVESPTTT